MIITSQQFFPLDLEDWDKEWGERSVPESAVALIGSSYGGVQSSALGKIRLIPHRDKYYTIHFITRLSF